MSGKLMRKDDCKKDYDRKVLCNCKGHIDHAKWGKTKELIPNSICVFCGQGGIAQFSTPDDPPVNIGSVTVDARELCKPLVKIKFSSLVNLTGTDANPKALLTFRLFRACDEGVAIPLNNWVYEAFNINDTENILRLNTSFGFIFCDGLNNGRSCDYFVEVSIGNTLDNATISVNNVHIQAIAQ